MHVFALNGIRYIACTYSPHGLQLSSQYSDRYSPIHGMARLHGPRRHAWLSAWMRLGYMNSMHEFIQHEHLSMARTGSSDPEPPGASTDTLPLLGASVVWSTCNMSFVEVFHPQCMLLTSHDMPMQMCNRTRACIACNGANGNIVHLPHVGLHGMRRHACAHATTRMTYIRKFEHISALWWCREAPEYGVTARAATIAIAPYSS